LLHSFINPVFSTPTTSLTFSLTYLLVSLSSIINEMMKRLLVKRLKWTAVFRWLSVLTATNQTCLQVSRVS